MSINSNTPPKGQTTASGSAPVVQAIDQSVTSRDVTQNEILFAILLELRVVNAQLQAGFLLRDTPASLRLDEGQYLN